MNQKEAIMLGLSRRRQRSKGFTLLELVIVIVILAILAGVAVPRYLRTVNRSRSAEAIAMLDQLRQAATRYFARNTQSYAGMAMTNIDFDPTDVGGTSCFTYGVAAAAGTFTFTATGSACGLAGTDTVTINQAGTVAGTGTFAGI